MIASATTDVHLAIVAASYKKLAQSLEQHAHGLDEL
jgi:hypothetical protein